LTTIFSVPLWEVIVAELADDLFSIFTCIINSCDFLIARHRAHGHHTAFLFLKVIAKVLGTAIGEYKDLRLDAMSALRKLIIGSQEANNEDNVKEMSRFAKNYLPILFNLYTTKPDGTDEEGQRLAAYETVKVLLCN
jgi:hypothetical protein